MSNQPVWKLVAQLGDVNPIDHGGYFVFTDETGVYAPEAELLISPEEDSGKWQIYRFSLEPCTFIDGILSDNKFHPDHPAWFANSIGQIAGFMGQTTSDMIQWITGNDLVDKAFAWQAIGNYWGLDNLDSCPLVLSRSEAEIRYSEAQYQMAH